MNKIHTQHMKIVKWLILASLLMFAFGFLLVPLYDVFCRITGINGKLVRTGPLQQAMLVDPTRSIKIQLVGINNENMPWVFAAQEPVIKVFTGESRQTAFVATNPTNRNMTAQAVPSIAPSEAAAYLHKINCFCFDQQQLASKAKVQMPLVFVVDNKLPKHIRTITISYTLFDITPQQKASTGQPTKPKEISL